MSQQVLYFFVPRISIIDNVVDFSGITTKQLRKTILAATGGHITETYYRLMSIDILELSELLDIYSELQEERIEEERKQLNKSKPNNNETIMEGNI